LIYLNKSNGRVGPFRLQTVDWLLLTLLLTANLPNRYLGYPILALIFLLGACRTKRLKFIREWRTEMLCWSLILVIMVTSFIIHFSSINNLFWGVFTTFPIIAYPFLLSKIKDGDKFIRTLNLFVWIQLIFCIGEFLFSFIQSGTMNFKSFFSNLSLGDNLAGTSIGFSSQMAITMGFLSLIYLDLILLWNKRNCVFFLILSVTMMIISGYMGGILMFCLSFLVFLCLIIFIGFIKARLKPIYIFVTFFLFLSGLALFFYQKDNIKYSTKILNMIFSSNPPVKVKSLNITFCNFAKDHPLDMPFGVGIGNYSSRAAFITGGQYLRPHPSFIAITPSMYFEKYMFPLYNYDTFHHYYGGVVGTSMINAPFLQIQTIFGEGGVLSLVLLAIIIITAFIKGVKTNAVGYPIAIVFFFLLMFTDNWLAFPTYCLMFWLLLLNINLINQPGLWSKRKMNIDKDLILCYKSI
jgi:hypothetical protein